MSSTWRNISYAILATCVYQIWRIRNEVLWNHKVERRDMCVQSIKKTVYNRMQICSLAKATVKDRIWIAQLCNRG